MKHVAYYQKPASTNHPFVSPAAIGTTIVPDGENVYQVAGELWLSDNVIIGDPYGHDTEDTAITAAVAVQDKYIRSRMF